MAANPQECENGGGMGRFFSRPTSEGQVESAIMPGKDGDCLLVVVGIKNHVVGAVSTHRSVACLDVDSRLGQEGCRLGKPPRPVREFDKNDFVLEGGQSDFLELSFVEVI